MDNYNYCAGKSHQGFFEIRHFCPARMETIQKIFSFGINKRHNLRFHLE